MHDKIIAQFQLFRIPKCCCGKMAGPASSGQPAWKEALPLGTPHICVPTSMQSCEIQHPPFWSFSDNLHHLFNFIFVIYIVKKQLKFLIFFIKLRIWCFYCHSPPSLGLIPDVGRKILLNLHF